MHCHGLAPRLDYDFVDQEIAQNYFHLRDSQRKNVILLNSVWRDLRVVLDLCDKETKELKERLRSREAKAVEQRLRAQEEWKEAKKELNYQHVLRAGLCPRRGVRHQVREQQNSTRLSENRRRLTI
jgi:hypothetical protein